MNAQRSTASLSLTARRALLRLGGVVAYVATLGSFYGLFAFLLDAAWLPRTIDRGPSSPVPLALAIDLGLIALFGLQHSVMARPTFKKWWTAWVPQAFERSGYMIVTVAVLSLLFWSWRPIPYEIWNLQGAWGTAALVFHALGWAVLFLTMFLLDHLELAGLRQTWLDGRGGSTSFRAPLLYRVIRHPMMLGWLLIFWATPRMTLGHLLFALGMTVYILIALHYEERNLAEAFGEEYLRYQRSIPKIIPNGRILAMPRTTDRHTPCTPGR